MLGASRKCSLHSLTHLKVTSESSTSLIGHLLWELCYPFKIAMGDKALSAVPMQPPLVKTKPTPLPDASGMEAVPKAGDGSLPGDITENTRCVSYLQHSFT